MPELPIRRIVLYKHGVGYFERRGPLSGTALQLSFPREAMDDVLKSLLAIDMGAGQVHGIDYETPEDRASRLARGSIHLSDGRSLLDLVRDLRGRRVRLSIAGENGATNTLAGIVVGVDLDEERPLRGPLVSLFVPDERAVRATRISEVERIELLDERATDDLTYFLRASQSEEDRRSATLRLSEGEHDLLVGYVAPAPAWRVSYRMLAEPKEAETASTSPSTGKQVSLLLQGWGLFDNQLDEDLRDVALTLVAGMPVSFRYRLYEPHTPERPMIADEERTVAAPVEFPAMAAGGAPMPPPAAPAPAMAKRSRGMLAMAEEAAPVYDMSIDAMATSTAVASSGEDRGALFQYRVTHPVSVARGQSAMVPIVGQRLSGRKELLYNGAKHPKNPVASLRAKNETGLTLERGPVTVIEDSDYAGEAVLPFTRPGGEMIVPYAVELGISVVEQPDSSRQIASISIRDELLVFQEWHVQSVTYLIQSSLAEPVDVVIERALPQQYELFDSPAPAEQSQGVGRWPVVCAPNTETRFTIQFRRMQTRHEQVRGVNGNQLREYLRRR
ncbi:MAG TPA: hypothetical protein VFT99_02415, partial [Roseiflexaceae bacterium]|nr:hypothetical protein [Roseiflexaceae bacterium]